MLDVEVFPNAADVWIAVIAAPSGDFSTQAVSAQDLAGAADAAVLEVLGTRMLVRLLTPDGEPWDLQVAEVQLQRALRDGHG